MNRLVLIDGNAVLHRAYHAIPPLTAPDGSIVNAVYGFAAMLFKIFQNLQPTHMAVAFDRPKPTFRKKLFDGYQSKRPEMDKDLAGQIDRVHELVHAFGIPIFEKDGFEADDVLATVSREALNPKSKILNKSKIQNPNEKKIDQVIIVTGDRDILQLVVDEKVLVYMPTKGLSEAKLYGEKEVVERMGVEPRLVPDLKALAGDPSDNYPGVAGVGPKTAVSLLKQFGSLKGVYRNVKDVTGKKKTRVPETIGSKLKAGEESALLGKQLATIRTDVPLNGALTQTASFDSPAARAFLAGLHFHSLIKRLNGGAAVETSKKEDKAKKASEPKEKSGQQQELF